jgi:hypothetical protein
MNRVWEGYHWTDLDLRERIGAVVGTQFAVGVHESLEVFVLGKTVLEVR